MTAAAPLSYLCVGCRSPLELPRGAGALECPRCRTHYDYDERFLRYPFDAVLFERHKRRYLLNKVLNNNAWIGYHTLPESSLSVSGRPDVARFRDFLRSHVSPGRLLDVGCGTLPLPGYLAFADRERFELVGLDPLDSREFAGVRIVGCSELLPFADRQFDAVVFATSLDHVCSVPETVAEAVRVLRPGGRLVVWMDDRAMGPAARIVAWMKARARNLLKGYRTDKYVVYPNFTVLYVPDGAADPFHSAHQDPDHIASAFAGAGLSLVDTRIHHTDEVFMCFARPADG